MTQDPILHALIDMVQAVETQGMVGPATPAYENALKVIRGRTAPGGASQPEGAQLERVARAIAREFGDEERWQEFSVHAEGALKAMQPGAAPTERLALAQELELVAGLASNLWPMEKAKLVAAAEVLRRKFPGLVTATASASTPQKGEA